jgi:hypothetical protein
VTIHGYSCYSWIIILFYSSFLSCSLLIFYSSYSWIFMNNLNNLNNPLTHWSSVLSRWNRTSGEGGGSSYQEESWFGWIWWAIILALADATERLRVSPCPIVWPRRYTRDTAWDENLASSENAYRTAELDASYCQNSYYTSRSPTWRGSWYMQQHR